MVDETDPIFDTDVPIIKHLTYREWHAAVNGFYVGFTAYKSAGDYSGPEKHYWRVGFLVGWLCKAMLIIYGYRYVLP